MKHRAVIFDIGGVIIDSPMQGIARYEREQGLADGFINRLIVDTGAAGAGTRLERGELTMEEFYPAFEGDCARAGASVDARDLMAAMAGATAVRPMMIEAVKRIRAAGLITAALTNNWKTEGGGENPVAEHFDAFVESSVVGLSKPDPRFYLHACEVIDVSPDEAVFLDDIGRNLKSARKLGMATIKVGDPRVALGELRELLGFPLGEN